MRNCLECGRVGGSIDAQPVNRTNFQKLSSTRIFVYFSVSLFILRFFWFHLFCSLKFFSTSYLVPPVSSGYHFNFFRKSLFMICSVFSSSPPSSAWFSYFFIFFSIPISNFTHVFCFLLQFFIHDRSHYFNIVSPRADSCFMICFF